jgi:ABC-type multidrug transport system ATPase subunit/pSer/pThr/pTyr-binding forkhead associated (FHA) protein
MMVRPSKSRESEKSGAASSRKPEVSTSGTVAFDIDSMASIPPQLIINEPGQDPKIHVLTAEQVSIGRQEDNDIVLTNRFVSRSHAKVEKRGRDYYVVPSPTTSNTLILNGQPVMEPTQLHHGDKIRIGGYAPGEVVTLNYMSPQEEAEIAAQQAIKFTENQIMKIGRHPDNDIVLPAPTVSLYHAEVEKIGQRYRLRDLRSSNGVFVNGKVVSGEVWVQPGDIIQIGSYRFVVDKDEFSKSDQAEGGVRVDVLGLNKWVNRKLNILQDISLVFQPKEFIVVVGQSGGGKSTLVDAIAGYRPATQGRVLVNEAIDVYRDFDAIRSNIGYVPQKDIIHMELTVFQALNYAARLRMPADTTKAERIKRIEEVMEDLDLAHRRDTQISQLSGGQQKRVSIGVELLNKPGFFFLDEPTSGLDPGMETELMHLMRRLADHGRTIVMITHATKNVMLADKVVFLARGGFLTWFGPPEEALTYFDQFRSERDRRSSSMEFDHIYTLLDKEELGSGEEWAKRYKEHAAYKKYIADPLGDKLTQPNKKEPRRLAAPLGQRNQVSAFRQFFILSQRNVKIMTRDLFSLVLLILIAPMMASLDFVLASGVGRDPTGFLNGQFNQYVVTLISITNTSVLVGGLAMMRELVKERDIYRRERRVNLKLSSYIMSKTWIAFILAIYQAACFTVIRYMAFEMPGGSEEKLFFFITEFLLVLSGTIVGLFCSALTPNANSAPLLLILFVIPQMVLSGALVQLPESITSPAPMRWAFQSYVAISGVGSDVAGDACWKLTQEEQDKLTTDEKISQCTCMGENSLRESSCNFPGLGKYYTDALDTKDPIKPVEPGPQPEEPVEPEKPIEPSNPRKLGEYLNQLDTYNDEVEKLRDDYKAEVDAWKDEQDKYKEDLIAYRTRLTDLEVKRATAVGSAESTIRRFKDQYGWTFVNKEDRPAYLKTLYTTWTAQIIICLVLFIGTVLMQKRQESG